MQTHDTHAINRRDVDILIAQLHHLLDAHRAELGEQELDHELEWLNDWIAQFQKGKSGTHQMDEHALEMLYIIHNKLVEATNEEKRMQAESPMSSPRADEHIAALDDTHQEVGSLLQTFKKTSRMESKIR